ncbi:MAG: NHL repeat-containing protein, partial [Candidatus Staskawiczbacteria bacterium]|nr:NHL repeat-containing protein [Candidatus Staskawiczbacteria bacterium]
MNKNNYIKVATVALIIIASSASVCFADTNVGSATTATTTRTWVGTDNGSDVCALINGTCTAGTCGSANGGTATCTYYYNDAMSLPWQGAFTGDDLCGIVSGVCTGVVPTTLGGPTSCSVATDSSGGTATCRYLYNITTKSLPIVINDSLSLAYFWAAGAGNINTATGTSGWAVASSGARNFGISYNVGVTNNATGAIINDGDSVTAGTKIRLQFVPHTSADIFWVGTGYSQDTPYGEWSTGASYHPVDACLAKDFVNDITVSCPSFVAQDSNGVPVDPASIGGISCNGAWWNQCPSGTFVCPSTGGAPYCIPADAVLCNGNYYSACQAGYTTVCPSSGDPICVINGSIQCNGQWVNPATACQSQPGTTYLCTTSGPGTCVLPNHNTCDGGATYFSCAAGDSAICLASGPVCVPPGSNYCNGAYYGACSQGIFVCSGGTTAQCQYTYTYSVPTYTYGYSGGGGGGGSGCLYSFSGGCMINQMSQWLFGNDLSWGSMFGSYYFDYTPPTTAYNNPSKNSPEIFTADLASALKNKNNKFLLTAGGISMINSTYSVYMPLVITPPIETISVPSGVTCDTVLLDDVTGASCSQYSRGCHQLCTINSSTSGSLTFTFNFTSATGTFFYRYKSGGSCFYGDVPLKITSDTSGGADCAGVDVSTIGSQYSLAVPAKSITYTINSIVTTGSCGTAGGKSYTSETSFGSDTLCATGYVANPSVPLFPNTSPSAFTTSNFWSVTNGGSYEFSTPSAGSWAWTGISGGAYSDSSLFGAALDTNGNLWVTDHSAENAMLRYSPAGGVTGYKLDASGVSLGLNVPYGVAIDASGNIWVANYGNGTAGSGAFVTKLSYSSSTDKITKIGTYSVGAGPYGVAIDANGNVWVANFGTGSGNTITELNTAGALLNTWNTGSGPTGVAIDANGNAWVSNFNSASISKIDPTKLVSSATTTYSAATGLTGDYALNNPLGIAVSSNGNILIANFAANANNKNVIKISPSGAPVASYWYGNNSTGVAYPTSGVAVDSYGYVWPSCWLEYWQQNTAFAGISFGDLSGFALKYIVLGGSKGIQGTTTSWSCVGSSSSAPCSASLKVAGACNNSTATAYSTGSSFGSNLTPSTFCTAGTPTPASPVFPGTAYTYTSNYGWFANGTSTIERVNFSTGASYSANFSSSYPGTNFTGIAVDPFGNVWFSDSSYGILWESSPASGNPDNFTNPTGNYITSPKGVASDAYGNIWVANYSSNMVTERTVAGSYYTFCASGCKFTANFDGPYGVAADSSGNIWVTNFGATGTGNTVTELIPSLPKSTYTLYDTKTWDVGTGPTGIATDSGGNMWVANYTANSVSKISPNQPRASATTTTDSSVNTYLNNPLGVAVDDLGNIWVANSGGTGVNGLVEITPAKSYLSSVTTPTNPKGVMIQPTSNGLLIYPSNIYHSNASNAFGDFNGFALNYFVLGGYLGNQGVTTNWTCNGTNGGIDANCSANFTGTITGTCGTAAGVKLPSTSSYGSTCSAGIFAKDVVWTNNSATATWHCYDITATVGASCTTGSCGSGKICVNSKCVTAATCVLNIAVDGTCGTANGVTLQAGSIDFGDKTVCANGTDFDSNGNSTLSVDGFGNITWACNPLYSGAYQNCKAYIQFDGACGNLNTKFPAGAWWDDSYTYIISHNGTYNIYSSPWSDVSNTLYNGNSLYLCYSGTPNPASPINVGNTGIYPSKHGIPSGFDYYLNSFYQQDPINYPGLSLQDIMPTNISWSCGGINEGGFGYTSVPAVTISGGGGSGATATASLKVGNVSLSNNGSGYTSVPNVSIDPPSCTINGTTCIRATANPSLAVGSIAVTNGGSGYTVSNVPTITISAPPTGGVQATAVVRTLFSGKIDSIAIVNGGSGYTSVPTVSFSSGGATATASLKVDNIDVTNNGSGYTSVPNVIISGGGGAVASASLTVGSIAVGNAGSGYTSAPTVSFSGGGAGAGALATATVSGGIVTLIAVGNNAVCNFSPIIDGACGLANGTPASSAPTASAGPTNLCFTTFATPVVSGTGPWSWQCAGSNGGKTASCSANYSGASVATGSCGTLTNNNVTWPAGSSPHGALCASGNSDNFNVGLGTSSPGPVTWHCGTSPQVTCTAKLAVNGVCGAAKNYSWYPSENLCDVTFSSSIPVSSVVNASGDGYWSWQCTGANGGTTVSCSTPVPPSQPINGTCGTLTNSGVAWSAGSTPSGSLCATGNSDNADVILSSSNPGPVSWNCIGLNGGSNINCTAQLKINGTCGPAATKFAAGTSDFSGYNLCSSGTVNPTNYNLNSNLSTASPNASWNCSGKNGGTSTTTACAASLIVNGACGSANGLQTISKPTTNLCSPATSPTVSGSGPWSWSCTGANGGPTADCTASPSASAGACGAFAKTWLSSETPSGLLCNSGNPNTSVLLGAYSPGPVSWNCVGSSTTATCTAKLAVNGACSYCTCDVPPCTNNTIACSTTQASGNGAVGTWPASYAPSGTVCSSGNFSSFYYSSDGTIANWICAGVNTGTSTPNTGTSSCKSISKVNGACGTAAQTFPANTTDFNTGLTLCKSGTPTISSLSSGSFTLANSYTATWTCNSINEPTSPINQSCSASLAAKLAVDAACGSANGIVVGTYPTSNLCSITSGTITVVDSAGTTNGTVGPWTWYCKGYNGGINKSCNAYPTGVVIDGQCGSSNGQTFSIKPTANLCSVTYVAPNVTGTGDAGTPWNWKCYGSNQIQYASCTAFKNTVPPVPIAGVCGSASGQTFASIPTGNPNLCSVTYSNTSISGQGTTATPWKWTCTGLNGGGNSTCTAVAISVTPPVNGVCNPILNEQRSALKPTSSLCSTGTATPSTPDGSGTISDPWRWTCSDPALVGGSSACRAFSTSTSTPVNGACGLADQQKFKDTAPTTNLCSTTFANPVVSGTGPWTWSCTGLDGGTTASCSASSTTNLPVNGQCGTFAQTFACGTVDFSGKTLCTYGEPDIANNS